jgi:hypothetical protein
MAEHTHRLHPDDHPRSRYVDEIRRACESGDVPLIRSLFAEAGREIGLQGLLPDDVEIDLGRLLTAQYQAGAGLKVLAEELGRTQRYVAKVLRLAGAVIRPAYRPKMAAPPVNLAELRRRYEAGSSISGLAHLIHYSPDQTRIFLIKAGAELRPRHPRPPGRPQRWVAAAPPEGAEGA